MKRGGEGEGGGTYLEDVSHEGLGSTVEVWVVVERREEGEEESRVWKEGERERSATRRRDSLKTTSRDASTRFGLELGHFQLSTRLLGGLGQVQPPVSAHLDYSLSPLITTHSPLRA